MLRGLSEDEIAKLEADPQLQRDTEQCLSADNVAQALVDEICAGVAEARSRVQLADVAAKQKNEVLRQAQNGESSRIWHEEEPRRRLQANLNGIWEMVFQQRGVTREQYQPRGEAVRVAQEAQDATGHAVCAVDQAQDEVWEAEAEFQRCSDELSARELLGKLAIDAVLEYQFRRSGAV